MVPIVIVSLSVFSALIWTPEMTELGKKWWPYLIGNGFCAFLLNITIATVIKRAGAMAFILSGLVKDIVIVCTASYLTNYPEVAINIMVDLMPLEAIQCRTLLGLRAIQCRTLLGL